MTSKNDWFRVDKEGLAQIYARRGPAAPLFELISNALDEEGVTNVFLTVTAVPNTPEVEILCVDDSTKGFLSLDDAYTLFAPSYKKGEAEQRGRFNLGEKLFLALCKEARITSIGGTLEFLPDGSLKRLRRKTHCGTEVYGRLRMTRAEAVQAFADVGRLRPPEGINVEIRFLGFDWEEDHYLMQRTEPCKITFDAKLQTELSDGEGVIRPTQRFGKVEVWDADRAAGWLFEMGIPVVEIGGQFDIDVHQKVPLNVERDNVTPAFLRRLRAHVLNHAYRRLLTKGDASDAWVTEAMGSSNPTPDYGAVDHVLELRFGKKRVAYDPSDKEGSQIAMSQGYAVVHGGSFPAQVWENVRMTESLKPAGQVTPSSKAAFSADGEDVSILRQDYPEGGRELCDTYARLAEKLIGASVEVRIVKWLQATVGNAPAACYGNRTILLSLRGLTKKWFKDALDATVLMPKHLALLIHELGHEYSASHLDSRFHESQTELGIAMTFMVIGEGKKVIGVKKSKVKRWRP